MPAQPLQPHLPHKQPRQQQQQQAGAHQSSSPYFRLDSLMRINECLSRGVMFSIPYPFSLPLSFWLTFTLCFPCCIPSSVYKESCRHIKDLKLRKICGKKTFILNIGSEKFNQNIHKIQKNSKKSFLPILITFQISHVSAFLFTHIHTHTILNGVVCFHLLSMYKAYIYTQTDILLGTFDGGGDASISFIAFSSHHYDCHPLSLTSKE